jgi:Secretion system C-terminal sorting domain
MKKLIIMLIVCSVCALWGEMPWQDIRFSATMSDNNIALRCQIIMPNETTLLFSTDEGVATYDMYSYPGIEYTSQGYLLEPDGERYFGFRSEIIDPAPDQVPFIAAPVFNQSGTTPEFEQLSWLLEDEEGDVNQGLAFLDITGILVSYDEDGLYLAMQNNGEGFPVSEAIWGPFYAYILIITPPELTDVPFGMLYTVDQQPYVQPGLYKMVGETMDDFQMVGEIDYTIDLDNDLLILECLWEDLLNDEDFTAWFDPDDPQFDFLVSTNIYSLDNGLEEVDFSDICHVYPQQFTAVSQENILPVISDFQIIEDSLISLSYYDENSNFSLIAQAVINDTTFLELYPQSLDYSQPVTLLSMESHPLLINDSWTSITLRVSDNFTDIVEETIINTDINPDYIPQPESLFTCYPNPFNPEVVISFNKSDFAGQKAELGIYNLKGQLLENLTSALDSAPDGNIVWDAAAYSSGIYLVKLKVNGVTSQTKKITLLK